MFITLAIRASELLPIGTQLARALRASRSIALLSRYLLHVSSSTAAAESNKIVAMLLDRVFGFGSEFFFLVCACVCGCFIVLLEIGLHNTIVGPQMPHARSSYSLAYVH